MKKKEYREDLTRMLTWALNQYKHEITTATDSVMMNKEEAVELFSKLWESTIIGYAHRNYDNLPF